MITYTNRMKEIVRLLKIERECVRRNSDNECDRNCAVCDLVQIDKDLLEMYDDTIDTIKKQIPVEPSYVDWGRHGRKAFCGVCGSNVRITIDKYCGRCGQRVKWIIVK